MPDDAAYEAALDEAIRKADASFANAEATGDWTNWRGADPNTAPWWVAGAVSGVNYFFRSATIISPDRRQLLLRRRGAPPQAEGDSPPAPVFWFLVYISGAVGNWETCCWFSSFPSALAAGAVEMWESRPHLARFPRGSWKEGEARLWLSTLSTAPPFPQLTSVF